MKFVGTDLWVRPLSLWSWRVYVPSSAPVCALGHLPLKGKAFENACLRHPPLSKGEWHGQRPWRMKCGRPRCAAPTGETVFPQWATARVAPTAFLRGDSERRVREAAPYKGRIPPERAGEDTRPYCGCGSILSFRRGRTLAGPSNGFCHSGAHPHPPRIRSAPSPWKGEGFRAADSRPYEQERAVPKSGGPGVPPLRRIKEADAFFA